MYLSQETLNISLCNIFGNKFSKNFNYCQCIKINNRTRVQMVYWVAWSSLQKHTTAGKKNLALLF